MTKTEQIVTVTKTCDRCGVVEKHLQQDWDEFTMLGWETVRIGEPHRTNSYELCPKCSNSIRAYLYGKELCNDDPARY